MDQVKEYKTALIVTGIVISSSACGIGNSSSVLQQSVSSAPGYDTLLSCDNSAATIEVSQTDKTDVVLATHDPSISRYVTYWPRNSVWRTRLQTNYGLDFDAATGPKLVNQPARTIDSADQISYFFDTFGVTFQPTWNSGKLLGQMRSVYQLQGGLKTEAIFPDKDSGKHRIVITS